MARGQGRRHGWVARVGERVFGAWKVCRLAGIERCNRKHKPDTKGRDQVVVQNAHIPTEQALAKDVITDIHAHKKPACDHPSHAKAKTYTKQVTSVGADVSCASRDVGVDIDDSVAYLKLSGKRRPDKATKRHNLRPRKIGVDLERRSVGCRGGSFTRTQTINNGGVEACTKQAHDFESKGFGGMEGIASTAHDHLHKAVVDGTCKDTADLVASFLGDGLELEDIHAIFGERGCDGCRQSEPQQA